MKMKMCCDPRWLGDWLKYRIIHPFVRELVGAFLHVLYICTEGVLAVQSR